MLDHAHKPTVQSAPPPSRPILQRACACGQHTGSGGECAECRKKRLASTSLGLQRTPLSQNGRGERGEGAPPIVHEVLHSPGQPLDAATRAFMEPLFGQDFSQVRVHTGLKAAESARAVNALAYTVGREVVFGAEQYNLQNSAGRKLIAHELTHVVQQSGAVSNLQRISILGGTDDSALEQEANYQALQVVASHGLKLARTEMRLGTTRLQKQTDITQATLDPRCVRVTGPSHVSGVDFLFPTSSSRLSTRQKGDIAAFAANWATSSPQRDVIIDGFASASGPESLNWRLSCDRAMAVKAELVTNGIPESRITTFAHGESTQFSDRTMAPNQRAVISSLPTITPTPTPTPSPTPTPAPACTPRTGTTEHGCYCGRGTSCPTGLTCPPMDALDACCQVHDRCYVACGCEFEDSINPFSSRRPAALACDTDLCNCVRGLLLTGADATYRDRLMLVFRC